MYSISALYFLLFSVLCLGIGLFLGAKIRNRSKLSSERNYIDEIATKERELSNYLLKLARNKELLTKVESKLNMVTAPMDQQTKADLKEIQSLIKEGKNENIFNEFDLSYQKINPRFFRDLTAKHEDLTAGDLRLASLLKLNLSTKEVATITFKNPVSVKTARTRLRKKLQLTDKEISISSYLNSLG